KCKNCPQLRKGSVLAESILKKKKYIFSIESHKLCFTVPSIWMLNRVKKSNMLKHYNRYTIPNLVDIRIFYNYDSNLRMKYNITSDEIVIGFASANINNKRKGISYLIEALDLINK